jgi:hypothetical protein
MRKWFTAAALAVALAVLCQPAPAQNKKDRKPSRPASSRLVPGAQVEKKVALLSREVTWHESLDEAKKLAREQKKAIFWLHALGDLDGDT